MIDDLLITASPPIQILVVEDERIIAINLKESLEALGYVVPAIADSAERAIEQATVLRPALVLMDIRLKGEMDGIEAAEQIWNRLQVPVIYVTGHSDQSTLERAKLTIPFGYILKPVQERELYVAIETALQRYEREQLLMAILRGMGDGVIVVDTESHIKYLNSVAEVLTGWKQNEAKDQTLATVLNIIDERTQQAIENPATLAIQQDKIVYLDNPVVLRSRNGVMIPISDSAAPLRDSKGKMTGAVLVFRDDTRRRLAEERNLAMQRSQQLELQMAELQRLNQLKDDFLSTVSHEMRTPLSNIKMAIRMLEISLDRQGLLDTEALSEPQPLVRYLTILNDQCNQELDLVNGLLDLRAIDVGAYPLELTSIPLEHWLPHVVESFEERAQAQQQRLQVDVSVDLLPLVSDLSILTRILSELLNNACKYTPPREQIWVTVCPIAVGQSSLTQGSGMIQIQVSNSGSEIPVEELTRIFEPFYRIPNSDRGRQGGTGLGLALVKKLVGYLQGNIQVTSGAGWTTFTIHLPQNLPQS